MLVLIEMRYNGTDIRGLLGISRHAGENGVKNQVWVAIWQQGKVREQRFAEDKLREALQDPSARIWIDIEGELGSMSSVLTRVFKLSHITVDGIKEARERAKLVTGNGYFYLVMHGMTYTAGSGETDAPKLDIVFGSQFLLTIHRESLPSVTALRAGVKSEKQEENLLGRGIAILLYEVLDTLVDAYYPVLDTLDDEIDALENQAIAAANDAVQAHMFRVKRAVTLLRRVMNPQIEVVNALITRTGDMIPTEIEPYFSDVHDHLIRCFEILDSYRDLMSSLLDVYLTTVSNRLNQVMKQMTIIATIFMPITFITGVFGMNFGHSPQVEHDFGGLFWVALLVMAAITGIQIWIFRRRGWL
jgi:magnesium transporter